MTRIRHILFASDLSAASRHAFATALSLARPLHARLTIVTVIPPFVPVIPEQYIDSVTIDRIDTQTRRWTARQLDKLAATAKKARVRSVAVIRNGEPADQILRAARSARADLIVLGTHGRRGLPKFFLGSVAERVAAMARCPVVTVR